jgi:putative ABC transport system permease protein
MLRLSLRDLRAHVGRYALTFLAVAIGVAFIGGVTTLTDTIRQTFDDLFSDVNAGTDAWVRGEGQFEAGAEFGGAEQRPRIDEALASIVGEVDGVAEVAPYVQGYTRPIDKEGEPFGNPDFGAPTFGSSWGTVDELNPFDLVEGSPPQGPDEIVFDKRTADETGYAVGDVATVQTPVGARNVTVVGIAKFGQADSPAGASFTMFDLATAEQLLAEPGKVDGIGIVAAEGVTQAQVRDRVAAALGSGEGDAAVEVVTGEELTEENQDDAAEGFGFIRTFLLVFALISVAVGTFVIYTSFSFIVAQRQRQVALLRAIGASRGQVLRSILLESAVVGVLASLVGYALGVALASVLARLIVDETSSLVILPTSFALAFAVGTLVTVGSAYFPAARASKVPPVAAMLDVAIDTSYRSRSRLALGGLLTALGLAALVAGVRETRLDVGSLEVSPLQLSGVGIFGVFVALVVLGPIAARPAALVLGEPVSGVRGIVGRLAQQNAARNPKRTASTASALMIGLGIVTLFLVVNASVRSSLDDLVDNRFSGDFVIDSGTGFTGVGLPGTVAQDVNALPEVDAATGIRFGLAEIDGSAQGVGGFDPATAFDLFDVEVTRGDVAGLDADGIAVFAERAEQEGWTVGDTLPVTFGETGEQPFTIVALLDSQDLTGTFLLSNAAFEANLPNSGDNQVWIRLAEGVTVTEARPALEGLLGAYPTAELQDLSEFKSATKAQFDLILLLINVLLALTILIAMIGIVNTLILSVVERAREISLTRAVGASRAQIRSSIRWEALLIAGFGLVAALGVGVLFGWVLVRALADQGFSVFDVPIRQLVLVTGVTGVLTLLAAVFPAVWAGRRRILAAIATE